MLVRLIFALSLLGIVSTLTQYVHFKGQLFCRGKPVSHATIRLMEEDWIDKNDLLATVKSDSNGRFKITGHEYEIFSITPYLDIDHICNVGPQHCEGAEGKTVVKLDFARVVFDGPDGVSVEEHRLDLEKLPVVFEHCMKEARPISKNAATELTSTTIPNHEQTTTSGTTRGRRMIPHLLSSWSESHEMLALANWGLESSVSDSGKTLESLQDWEEDDRVSEADAVTKQKSQDEPKPLEEDLEQSTPQPKNASLPQKSVEKE